VPSGPGGALAGRRVVVTAGGTREAIDPVRFIGNRSSGKMGNALAAACLEAGAAVELVTAAPPPPPAPGLRVCSVESAAEMRGAVWGAMDSADILLMAAAVADYRPRHVSPRKLKKSAAALLIELEPTEDILASVRVHPQRPGVLVVGFAAETDDPEANAAAKLREKGLDLIVLNDVSQPGIGMGSDDNAVTVLDGRGVVAVFERMPKAEIARRLVALVAERVPSRRG
jgi:phosphopantothenoylcysteine decarboxylase/phosphopantothenate--cysteine ligase